MKALYRKLLIVGLFALAMGLFESVVVIYLRRLMYPGGFSFPLAPIDPSLALIELSREGSTLVMLVCVSMLAARTFSERFAWFIYSFAIWDIFYYIFLWLFIGWPGSVMAWDVLFLIPATWTGPVITPLIVTVLMIALALVILTRAARGIATRLTRPEWIALLSGALIVFVAFITDYLRHMLTYFSFGELFITDRNELLQHAQQYMPGTFPWPVFLTGMVVIGVVIAVYYRRLERSAR